MNARWTMVLPLLLAGALPARGSEVREKVANLAGEIGRLVKDEGQTQVAVGEITGPPLPKTAAGPLFQTTLVQELARVKVGVNDAAFVVVKGEYFVLEGEGKDDGLTVRLTLVIRNNKGKKIGELPADIGYRGNDDLIKTLALQTDLSGLSNASREKVNEKLKQDLKTPPLRLAGTKVKTTAESPFAVELFKRPKGGGTLTPVPVEERDKLAWADIGRGNEYVLRLHNASKLEAAAAVVIDGVGVFQFFEGPGLRPGFVLVAPGKTRDVAGWRIDANAIKAFEVGKFADSPAAKVLKSSAKVGTITVLFSHSWEKGKTPDEYKDSSPRSLDPDATVLGRKIEEKAKVVPRTIGPRLAAVSVRYGK